MMDPNDQRRAIVSRPLEIRPFLPASAVAALELGAFSVCGEFSTQNTDHYLALRLGRVCETLTTSLAAGDLPSRFEESSYAMLVADGIGDAVGARASRVALSALAHSVIEFGRWLVRIDADAIDEIIGQGEFFYTLAHDAVRQAGRVDFRLAGMATSLTALYIVEDHLFFAHVGHSSAFLWRDGTLTRLTPEQGVDDQQTPAGHAKALLPTAWESDESATDVTEMIGGRLGPGGLAVEHINLLSGDRLLLCTNGLTDVVTSDRIADVLAQRRSPKEDCRQLIDLAVGQACADNATAVLADYTLRRHPTHP